MKLPPSRNRIMFKGEQPLHVSTTQREMLIRRGLAVPGSIFTVALADRATVEAALESDPESMNCDFCSTRPCVVGFVTDEYDPTPHVPFYNPVTRARERYQSIGGYAACADCAPLVRERKQEEVLQRSLEVLGRRPDMAWTRSRPQDWRVFEEAVRGSQAAFFIHWNGEERSFDGEGDRSD
jgi:hypothetical protein